MIFARSKAPLEYKKIPVPKVGHDEVLINILCLPFFIQLTLGILGFAIRIFMLGKACLVSS